MGNKKYDTEVGYEDPRDAYLAGWRAAREYSMETIEGYKKAIEEVTKWAASQIDPEFGPDECDGFWSKGWEKRFGYVKEQV